MCITRSSLVMFYKFVNTLVLIVFLAACGGGGGNDPTDDGTNPDPNTDPTPSGFELKLNLEADDFWEFYWFTENTTFSQGSGASSSTSFGIYRVTLGTSTNTSGLVAYPLIVTGTAGPYQPRWTHVALNADGSLLGSVDGANFEIIFDITSAKWNGGGFFHDFENNLVSITEDSLVGEYNTVDALKLGFSDSEGGCETILGQTLCDDTSTTFSFNEYHKEGVGPVGFRQDTTYTSDGGGFFTSSTIKKTVELIETTEVTTDLTVFNRPDWEEMAPLATARSDHSAVVLDGKIYVLGGFDGDNILASMEIYDPVTNQWSNGPSMPSATNSEAQAIGGKIYIESSVTADDIHIYDTALNSWSTISVSSSGGQFGASDSYNDPTWGDLIVGVRGASVANHTIEVWAFQASGPQWLTGVDLSIWEMLRPSSTILDDHTMYVIGGFGGKARCDFFSCSRGALDWVFKYDLLVDNWDTVSAAKMNTARDSLETVELNGKIIAIGGNSVSCSSSSCNIGAPMRSAESYDPATNLWTDISSMLTPRQDFAAVVLNGDLFVIGGDDGSAKSASVERYQPQ